ncbi:MAG: hypothetical protein JWL83_933 [Actinomycetia bacterium]|nr:hypothetical protein [Actinomycetes bacterium]
MSGDQRRFAVLLAVLALLVAIVIGRTLIGGGGSSPKAAERPIATRHFTKAAAKVKAKAKAHHAVASAANDLAGTDSFQVFATRDPFQPPFDNTPTTTVPTTNTTVPGGGSVTPPTTSPTGTTTPTVPPTTQPPSFNPGSGQTIAVLDVFTEPGGTVKARVRVGSTVYTVGVGDTFATSYKVVSLNPPCGQFLFGDSPFTLCIGEETIK